MSPFFTSRFEKIKFPLFTVEDSTPAPRVATLVSLGFGFVVLAAALRVVFLDWGLPYIYHGDEPLSMAIIHRMITESDLDPQNFWYPSFLYYINLPGQYLVKLWDGTLLPFTMQSTGNGFTEQPEAFRVGRVTTLIFGLAILPTLIIWARMVAVGLAGLFVLGALFCLNPLLIRHSTLISPAIFATFFTTGTLLATSLIVLRGVRWTYVLAGLMAGLAASSKYNAGLVAVAIPVAHVIRSGLSVTKLGPVLLAALTAGLVFLLSDAPFLVLHPLSAPRDVVGQMLDGFLGQVRHYHHGHPGFEGHTFAATIGFMFDNFGYAGLLAIGACFSPRARALLPAALFIAAYFLLLVLQRVHFDRNILPLVPAMLLLIAAGIDPISQIVARALPNARLVTPAILGVLALLLFARPAMLSLDEVSHYRQDPRAEARVWINAILPRTPARPIAVEFYTPYIDEEGRAVTPMILALDEPDFSTLAPFSYLVLSKQGSGRFLQGPYEMQRAHLAALKARSCNYRQFPAETAEPDYWVFALKCD